MTSQEQADTLLRAFWDEREQKRREQSNPPAEQKRRELSEASA